MKEMDRMLRLRQDRLLQIRRVGKGKHVRPSLRKRIRRVIVVLVGVWIVYVAAVHIALRSDFVRDAINRKPDRFFMEWQAGTSLFPGFFRLKGVSFLGQGTRSIYYGRLDDVRFHVRLIPLVSKSVEIVRFTGRGIEFRLSKPGNGTNTSPDELRFQPTIPGLEKVPVRTAPRRIPGPPSWKIAGRVTLRGIEQVWIYGDRLVGPGSLDAHLDMRVNGEFRVRAEPLDFPAATFLHEGTMAATNLAMRVDLEMGPVDFHVASFKGARFLDYFSAELTAKGQLGTVRMLRQQLGSHDYLDFGGGGAMDARIQLSRGLFEVGSSLSIEAPSLRLTRGHITLSGAARIQDQVQGSTGAVRTQLEINLKDLQIFHRGELIGAAPGSALGISSTARSGRVDEWLDNNEFELRLDRLIFPVGSWVNQYLPQGVHAEVTEGSVSADARFNATGPRGSGSLQLDGRTLGLRINGLEYRSNLQLSAQFSAEDLAAGRLDLGGTSLLFTNVQIPGLEVEHGREWQSSVRITEGHLVVTTNEWQVDSSLAIALQDTEPIMVALRSRPDPPGWLSMVPTLRDLEGQTRLRLSPKTSRLEDLRFDGAATEIRGELETSTNGLRGIAYARYGIISVGVDLREEKPDWRLFGAKRWYERALGSPFRRPESR